MGTQRNGADHLKNLSRSNSVEIELNVGVVDGPNNLKD